MNDILSRVDITARAMQQYDAFAKRVALQLVKAGIRPHEIPEEQGEELGDGSLLVYIDIPHNKGRVEFKIPSSEWAWNDRN